MTKRYFAISDIHGQLRQFNELLKYFNPNTDTLVLLGDYVDRGSDSLGVIRKLMELRKQLPKDKLFILRGNHDQMFLDYFGKPHNEFYLIQRNGGPATIVDMYTTILDENPFLKLTHPAGTPEAYGEMRKEINKSFKSEIAFLQNEGMLYLETPHLLFTHAGYNPKLQNWKETDPKDFYWIRGHYNYRPSTHLLNVFGHTPTHLIRGNHDNSPYHLPGYLGIDGGSAYGGTLNGVFFSEQGEVLGLVQA